MKSDREYQLSLLIFLGEDPGGKKRCSLCRKVKPLEDFYPLKNGRRESRCSACDYQRKQTPAYREFERNRKATARANRPMMEPKYQASRRIRQFEQQRREFDLVP